MNNCTFRNQAIRNFAFPVVNPHISDSAVFLNEASEISSSQPINISLCNRFRNCKCSICKSSTIKSILSVKRSKTIRCCHLCLMSILHLKFYKLLNIFRNFNFLASCTNTDELRRNISFCYLSAPSKSVRTDILDCLRNGNLCQISVCARISKSTLCNSCYRCSIEIAGNLDFSIITLITSDFRITAIIAVFETCLEVTDTTCR